MHTTPTDQAVITRLNHWAQSNKSIRAMLLYSSRANPDAVVDRFSDYDILLAVDDVRGFHQDDSWMDVFGDVNLLQPSGDPAACTDACSQIPGGCQEDRTPANGSGRLRRPRAARGGRPARTARRFPGAPGAAASTATAPGKNGKSPPRVRKTA